MAASLRRLIIAGAALDVYDEEPLYEGHPLAKLENVVLTGDRVPDYTDDSLTQNGRAGYPLEFVEKRVEEHLASKFESRHHVANWNRHP